MSGADAQARVAQKAAPRATATARVQPRARKRGKRGGFPALSLPIAGTSTVLPRTSSHRGLQTKMRQLCNGEGRCRQRYREGPRQSCAKGEHPVGSRPVAHGLLSAASAVASFNSSRCQSRRVGVARRKMSSPLIPSGLSWTCCGGQRFVSLPLLGTVHVPTAAHSSSMLPILVTLLAVTAALIALPLCAAIRCLSRTRSSYRTAERRRRLLHLALLVGPLGFGYPLLAFLLRGDVGRQLMRLNLDAAPTLPDQGSVGHVEEWQAQPGTSPLASWGGEPMGNLTIWSESEAAVCARTSTVQSPQSTACPDRCEVLLMSGRVTWQAVAARVAALRLSHWIYILDLSRGSGLFVLGAKCKLCSPAPRDPELLYPTCTCVASRQTLGLSTATPCSQQRS